MLREYLTERVESATDWSYGQVETAGENVYELTATASTLLHEITPPPIFESEGAGGRRISDARPRRFQKRRNRAVSPDRGR